MMVVDKEWTSRTARRLKLLSSCAESLWPRLIERSCGETRFETVQAVINELLWDAKVYNEPLIKTAIRELEWLEQTLEDDEHFNVVAPMNRLAVLSVEEIEQQLERLTGYYKPEDGDHYFKTAWEMANDKTRPVLKNVDRPTGGVPDGKRSVWWLGPPEDAPAAFQGLDGCDFEGVGLRG